MMQKLFVALLSVARIAGKETPTSAYSVQSFQRWSDAPSGAEGRQQLRFYSLTVKPPVLTDACSCQRHTPPARRRLRVTGKTSSGLIIGMCVGQGRTHTSEDAMKPSP